MTGEISPFAHLLPMFLDHGWKLLGLILLALVVPRAITAIRERLM